MATAWGKFRRVDGKLLITIEGRSAFWESAAEEILGPKGEAEIEIEVRRPKIPATDSQKRYLWGHLAHLAFQASKDAGLGCKTKEDAIRVLKHQLGFVELEFKESPMGLSDDKTLMGDFIQELFLWLLEAGSQPIHPEDYNKN